MTHGAIMIPAMGTRDVDTIAGSFLASWWAADNPDNVLDPPPDTAQLTDKSASGYNLAESEASKRPHFVVDALDFNEGAGQGLKLQAVSPDIFLEGHDGTILCVGSSDAVPNNATYLDCSKGASSNTGLMLFPNTTLLYARALTLNNGLISASAAHPTAGELHVCRTTLRADEIVLGVDKVETPTPSVGHGGLQSGINSFGLGYDAAGTNFHHGKIKEIIVLRGFSIPADIITALDDLLLDRWL